MMKTLTRLAAYLLIVLIFVSGGTAVSQEQAPLTDSERLGYLPTTPRWDEMKAYLRQEYPNIIKFGEVAAGAKHPPEVTNAGARRVQEILFSCPITSSHYDVLNVIGLWYENARGGVRQAGDRAAGSVFGQVISRQYFFKFVTQLAVKPPDGSSGPVGLLRLLYETNKCTHEEEALVEYRNAVLDFFESQTEPPALEPLAEVLEDLRSREEVQSLMERINGILNP